MRIGPCVRFGRVDRDHVFRLIEIADFIGPGPPRISNGRFIGAKACRIHHVHRAVAGIGVVEGQCSRIRCDEAPGRGIVASRSHVKQTASPGGDAELADVGKGVVRVAMLPVLESRLPNGE